MPAKFLIVSMGRTWLPSYFWRQNIRPSRSRSGESSRTPTPGVPCYHAWLDNPSQDYVCTSRHWHTSCGNLYYHRLLDFLTRILSVLAQAYDRCLVAMQKHRFSPASWSSAFGRRLYDTDHGGIHLADASLRFDCRKETDGAHAGVLIGLQCPTTPVT